MHTTPTRSAARQVAIRTHHGSELAFPSFFSAHPTTLLHALHGHASLYAPTHAYDTQWHVANKTDPSSGLGAPGSGGEPLCPVSDSRTPSPIPPRGVLGVVRPLRLRPSPLSPKRSGRLRGDSGPLLPLVSTSATSFAIFSCITASSSSGSADRRPFPAACSQGEWSGSLQVYNRNETIPQNTCKPSIEMKWDTFGRVSRMSPMGLLSREATFTSFTGEAELSVLLIFGAPVTPFSSTELHCSSRLPELLASGCGGVFTPRGDTTDWSLYPTCNVTNEACGKIWVGKLLQCACAAVRAIRDTCCQERTGEITRTHVHARAGRGYLRFDQRRSTGPGLSWQHSWGFGGRPSNCWVSCRFTQAGKPMTCSRFQVTAFLCPLLRSAPAQSTVARCPCPPVC